MNDLGFVVMKEDGNLEE